MLTRPQWLILDCLSDQDEPLESVYSTFAEGDQSQDPVELLTVLFELWQWGFVVFRQEPIMALRQEVASRAVLPETPAEIVGDCGAAFEQFRLKRDYLHYLNVGQFSAPAGVPFGIWIERTPMGHAEWERPEYAVYWAP